MHLEDVLAHDVMDDLLVDAQERGLETTALSFEKALLQREPVRKSLDQYRVALLDLWSDDSVTTPDGTQTTVRKWADALDIKYAPSMLFFDRDGKEVFRTGAYLKAFHVHGALDYVLDGHYRAEPEFQRYLRVRREEMEAKGIRVDLME